MATIGMYMSYDYGYSSAAVDVSSCDDLANINNDLSTGYTLTQDLDCSGSGNSIMIGTQGTPFLGEFDGQGYTIVVDINSTENYIGLFRSVDSANISNLILAGSVISTHENFMMGEGKVGGLAGYTTNTIIDNVQSYAYVQGSNSEIGGLIGNAFATTISDSSVSATVLGSGNYSTNVGGLVGRAQNNTVISRSYTVGDVEASATRVGGLVGIITDSTIQTSYAAGDVISQGGLGGLIGWSFSTNISNTYARGNVTANGGWVGGLIAFVDSTNIANSYAAGAVTGHSDVGGLVGRSQGGSNTATESFWDTDATGIPTSLFGQNKTTIEMKDIDTFSGAAWDFDTIWSISGDLNNGYPYLQWQTFAEPETDLLIYMNDNGPIATGSSTHSYSIEYVNGGSNTEDVLITLEGVDINNFQQASGLNDPSFSGYTDSYIQRTEALFADGASGSLEFLISHDSDGVYVYTATISSVIPDSHLSNNSFTVFSTVDTIAPDTFITFAASFAVDSATATFEFSANEDSTFECSIDDGITIEDFAPCTSPYTRSNFVQGEHIFYVRAVDVQGNTDQTPATKTWIIADSEEIVSVTPADGDINVATDATIVVTFAQPVLLDITIATGPCDGVGNICPELDGVWSNDNTVITYTRTDEDFHNNTSYSIQITQRNGIFSHQLYSGSFTIVSTPVPSGGGGGGGGSVVIDHCPSGDTSGSYYDRQCVDAKSLVEKIVAKLTNDWKDRSNEKIQGMLATLTLLNSKIQEIESVSTNMKQLFQSIVDGLIKHYSS